MRNTPAQEAPREISKRAVFSWFLFDWANSSFPVIVMTFLFATYFTEKIAINKILGTAQWGDAMALSGISIAILSPIVGAIADYAGKRKPWLAFFSLLCIAASALLWYAEPNAHFVYWTLTFVVFGTIGLEIGMVFYNAMLSDISPKRYLGRLSGWGWGFGYIGGIVCLSIALFVFVENRFGLFHFNTAMAENIRICGPLVAAWFLVFGWPLFFFTPDHPSSGVGIRTSIPLGIKMLGKTLRSLKDYREILKFLLARLLYIDGLNTVFAFGGIFAAGVYHFSFTHVLILGIILNVGAGIGAAAFAFLDDFRGAKLTILITLGLMLISMLVILTSHSVEIFWIFAVALSLCVGPIQAASRSLMIRIAPKHLMTEMFGLYAFSGKATAFLGPFMLAMITEHFASQRIGMASVLFFLVSGAIILCFVKTNENKVSAA